MAIDAATVAKVAELARLEFSPAEAAQLAQELGRVLDYVAQLQKLPEAPQPASASPEGETLRGKPLAAGEPVLGLGQPTQLRPDLVAPSLPAQVAIAGAARTRDTAFLVPRILD